MSKNLNLSNVGISTLMLILQDTDLNKHRFNEMVLLVLRIRRKVTKFEGIPANRLVKFNLLHFLELLKRILNFDRYFLWGV